VAVSPTIVAIRDTGSSLFGCFVTAPWKRNPQPNYYGSGESFIWSLAEDGEVRTYRWSEQNNYFQSSTADFLAVGGGGHYAFRIDSDLQFGSSGKCGTFNSPCVASNEDFECVDLELWGLEVPRRQTASSLLIL
jgi:hypothetical protein